MKVTGVIVDSLISIKDFHDLSSREREVINIACNIIDTFPNTTSIETAKNFIKSFKSEDVSLGALFEKNLSDFKSLIQALNEKRDSGTLSEEQRKCYIEIINSIEDLRTKFEGELRKLL